MAKVKKGCCGSCSDHCTTPFTCNTTIPPDANETCPNGYTKTDCIIYSGETDSCLGINNGMIGTDVIDALKVNIKDRLVDITSETLVITDDITNPCEKVKVIEFVPSTDIGNILIFGTDGKPYVPTTAIPDSPEIVATDSNSVKFTTGGTLNHEITADVAVQDSTTITLSIDTNGIKAEVKLLELLQAIDSDVIAKAYFCQMVASCAAVPCIPPSNLTVTPI